jgi:hypothetical protein
MSSLQKFHRRTNNAPSGPITWPATAIGGGDDAHGYWLGDISTNKLVVAPKSTESPLAWGSYGTVRGTTSLANGLANTNTLASFGTSAHPAAGHCKYLSTGGYNTWYMPALNELNTLYSNKSKTPFATSNAFVESAHWSSNEYNNNFAWSLNMSNGVQSRGGTYGSGNWGGYKYWQYNVRAVRRTTI